MKLDRIISIATLVALVIAIVVMLKRPASVAQDPRPSAGIPAAAQHVDASGTRDRIESAAQTLPQSQAYAGSGYSAPSQPATQNLPATQSAKAEPQTNSERISAALNGLLRSDGAPLSPDAEVGSGTPNIKDQKVTYDGDTVHGQFLTEIAGKDVWVTISGHMGQKDGYATFDPTEFKVGDVDVPVSLVNPMLQRKLSEERDRMKISSPAQ